MKRKRSKIQRRIFMHVVIVTIITLFISVFAIASVTLNEYLKSEVDNSLDKTLKTKQNIEYIFRSANEMSYTLASDVAVIELLTNWQNGNSSYSGSDETYNNFQFLVDKLHAYDNITIVGYNPATSEWAYLDADNDSKDEKLLQQMNSGTTDILGKGYFIDSSNEGYQIYRNIKDSDNKLMGAVIVELNNQVIREVFASSSYEYQNEKIAIVNEDGEVILSFPNNTDFQSILEENDDLLRYNTQIINQKVFNKQSILISNSINYTDWQIIRIIKMDSIYQVIYSSVGVALAILVILIITAVLSSFSVAKTITEPILKLRQSVIEFEQADYAKTIISDTDDEIGELADTFNDIGKRLRDSVDKIIDNEKRKVEFQLKILQAQINPHFLYNTLDSIRWMAIINKQEQIAEMVITIIKLLRYNISDVNSFIALEEEIECIKNYVSIQSYRFGKTVDIIYDIEEVKDLKVVKFLLQPLVENSIYHGSASLERDIIIIIKGFIHEENLILNVIDNGVGIIKKAEKPVTSKMHSGIGVENIKQRIKLYFGEQYDLEMIPLDPGVEVRLTLPILKD